MKKRKNNEGNVYYGNTKYIDFDKKPRRCYVIVSDKTNYDMQNIQ